MRAVAAIAGLTVGLGLIGSNAAAASTGGIDLTAPKTVAVTYDQCQDPFGNPVACVSPDFVVTNNTDEPVTCSLEVKEINFEFSLGTIAPGTSAGGGLTAPYEGQKALTFLLSCDGADVPGGRQRVRVIPS